MKPVFLSASVPDPKRHEKYFKTADIVAIRDAVTALVEVVLPVSKIYFGGHPAITPMIRREAQRLELIERVALFQSREFENSFPPDNRFFPDLRLFPDLSAMRRSMIGTDQFSAAFFIGGMEGIEREWVDVAAAKVQEGVPLYPIASTGGAALLLLEENPFRFPEPLRQALRTDFNYTILFRRMLQLAPDWPHDHDINRS